MLHTSALVTIDHKEGKIELVDYARNKMELMSRNVSAAVKKELITQYCGGVLIGKMQYEPESWEDLFEHYDQLWTDYAEILKHKNYYFTLEKIEKGEAWIAQQTEPAMIAKGWARLRELEKELDALAPRDAETYQASECA